MGLFDSKSKTKSNVVSGEVANYNAGAAQTFAGISGTNTFNVSDYGAIEKGVGLAQLAIESNGAAFKDAISKTLTIAQKTQVSESAQFQDSLVKLALIIGAAVAAIAIFKVRH